MKKRDCQFLIDIRGSDTLCRASRVTVASSKRPNSASHPSNIIFVMSDQKGYFPPLSKITVEQGMQLFLSGYDGSGYSPFYADSLRFTVYDPKVTISSMKQRITDKNVNLFVVNLYNRNSSELKQRFKSIFNGTAVDVFFKTNKQTNKQTNIYIYIMFYWFPKIDYSIYFPFSERQGKTAEKGRIPEEVLKYISTKFPTLEL
jgi:hypothetical protein